MTWKPTRRTREPMEERRMESVRLRKAPKLSQAEIARWLGVSRAAVSQGAQRLAPGGRPQLRRRSAGGRPPQLTPAQPPELQRLLKRGALAAGFPTDRWTLKRIQQVIKPVFGVTDHVNSLSDVLTRLGWSVQQPRARAQERAEDVIRAWLEQAWPRIKKGAAPWRRPRIFRGIWRDVSGALAADRGPPRATTRSAPRHA